MKRKFSSCIGFHAILSLSSVWPPPAPAAFCFVAKGSAQSRGACSEAVAGFPVAHSTLATRCAEGKWESGPFLKLSR